MAKVVIDNSGLVKVRKELRAAMRSTSNTTEPRKILKQWGTRYLAFIAKRYDKFSRGGGDWKPLAPSTIAARRKGKGRTKAKTAKSGGASILKDTGTMRAALSKGNPGNRFENFPGGIRVGFGPAKHPGGGASIAQIAAYHHEGAGRLPKREIIVAPDQATQRGMEHDARMGLARLLKKHEIRGRGR